MGDTLQRFWRLTVSDDVTVQRDGAVTFVPGRKVAALLAYLAIEGPTPRALLADLLWPLAASPRNSLRQAVHALRKRAPIADGDPLRLSTGVRVDEGEGDLLSAYDLSDCAELHAWTEFQVERRRVARIERWAARADTLEVEGRMTEALAAARRALAADRLSELAHRRVIRLAYLAGDRAAWRTWRATGRRRWTRTTGASRCFASSSGCGRSPRRSRWRATSRRRRSSAPRGRRRGSR